MGLIISANQTDQNVANSLVERDSAGRFLATAVGLDNGAAGTPAIYPSADTNTGLFFPAADTIAFAGGGAEFMRIDSSGNVGIGTNNPVVELALVKSKPAFPVVLVVANSSGAAYSQSQISATCTSSTGGTVNAFVLAGSNNEARFGSTGGAFPVTFNTNGVERARFDAVGKLGLGTTAPDYLLDARGGARAYGIMNSALSTPSAPSGTTATTGGTIAAGTYYAKVVAIDGSGNSTNASAASSGVTTTGSTSTITWTWSAIANATSYNIYIDTTVGGSFVYAAGVTGTSYTQTVPHTSLFNTVFGPSTRNLTGGINCAGAISGTRLSINDDFSAGNVPIIVQNTSSTANSRAGYYLYNNTVFTNFGTLSLSSSNSTPANELSLAITGAAPITFFTDGSERGRFTADGNFVTRQATPHSQNTSATLTVPHLRTRIITSNAAVTLTLPTGTDLETYTSGMVAETAFEVTFIATAAGAITIGANGNTTVGSLTVAGNTSGTYRFRKTGTNAFTVYRV